MSVAAETHPHQSPLFRCWHRSTQESDFILGMFADASLAGLRQSVDRVSS
jgi:succinate dehydrogenase flavin-adding protein (antitoxin of CptAB toxin-antitoxin module)